MARKKSAINRSAFCREYIEKAGGLKNASVDGMRQAWKEAGHPSKDCPSGTLFYQQTKKLRGGKTTRKIRKSKAATTAVNGDLFKIEKQLEELTAQAEGLKSSKLAAAIRNARRQAGAEILAAN